MFTLQGLLKAKKTVKSKAHIATSVVLLLTQKRNRA